MLITIILNPFIYVHLHIFQLEGQKLKETTPNKPSKHQKDSEVSEKQITPSSSSKTHPSNDDVTPDALEKRRHHAEQYRKYMQRAGPAHLHSKEIPQVS
jgi:hypothetical protein